MSIDTWSDQVAADRLLKKSVSIAQCYLALAKTDEDYQRVYDDNRSRFYNACVAASTLVEVTP